MRAESGKVIPTRRFWRYAPLIVWMLVIFFASSDDFSASSTSRFIRPLFVWLFPNISEGQLVWVHFLIRKSAHFVEYAVLGFLAARAFSSSSIDWLRRFWGPVTLVLIVGYAFMDEYRQSFVPTRSASIWDSFIDIAGGLTALAIFSYWRRYRWQRSRNV
ncbi:MAG TPA: VanZ family protein [Pyrinomonadaceae bacterium]|nr:VanZ family protein [Pyrinomonadaceae bacterium]